MTTWKRGKLVVMLAAAMLGGGFVAQGRAHACDGEHGRGGEARGPERMQQRLERLSERLALTPAQRQQVQRIMEEARAERERVRGDGGRRDDAESPRGPGADRGARREAMRAAMERVHERIAAVLTPAQRAQFQEMRREREARMRERFEGHGGRQGGQRGPGWVDPRGI